MGNFFSSFYSLNFLIFVWTNPLLRGLKRLNKYPHFPYLGSELTEETRKKARQVKFKVPIFLLILARLEGGLGRAATIGFPRMNL